MKKLRNPYLNMIQNIKKTYSLILYTMFSGEDNLKGVEKEKNCGLLLL